jgi:hypothetical protein
VCLPPHASAGYASSSYRVAQAGAMHKQQCCVKAVCCLVEKSKWVQPELLQAACTCASDARLLHAWSSTAGAQAGSRAADSGAALLSWWHPPVSSLQRHDHCIALHCLAAKAAGGGGGTGGVSASCSARTIPGGGALLACSQAAASARARQAVWHLHEPTQGVLAAA